MPGKGNKIQPRRTPRQVEEVDHGTERLGSPLRRTPRSRKQLATPRPGKPQSAVAGLPAAEGKGNLTWRRQSALTTNLTSPSFSSLLSSRKQSGRRVHHRNDSGSPRKPRFEVERQKAESLREQKEHEQKKIARQEASLRAVLKSADGLYPRRSCWEGLGTDFFQRDAIQLLVSDVQYGLWSCCKKVGKHAAGCIQASEHKLAQDGWARCSLCDQAYQEKATGQGHQKGSSMYARYVAQNECRFHRGSLEHRGGKLWLYACCNGVPGAVGCTKGAHVPLDQAELLCRIAPRGVGVGGETVRGHWHDADAESRDLCVQCGTFVSESRDNGGGKLVACRYHKGSFQSEIAARTRTMVPLAPHHIAVLVNFQHIKVVFRAPIPIGESGCTNPHLFAIAGRSSAACGFAGISEYELLFNGGHGGRLMLDANTAPPDSVPSSLPLQGIFPVQTLGDGNDRDTAVPTGAARAGQAGVPATADGQHKQVGTEDSGSSGESEAAGDAVAEQAALPSADSARGIGLQTHRMTEAAKALRESGESPTVWHKLRIISRTRQDASRPFPGWRGDESEEIKFTIPELSTPVISVQHTGQGQSLRVSWTTPVGVGGATLLDFVVCRWRRVAGGRPTDLDIEQDGMPPDYNYVGKTKSTVWGLKGAALPYKSTGNETVGVTQSDPADAQMNSDSPADGATAEIEGEWKQVTVALNQTSFVISALTEGALYEIEVEAAGKYSGPTMLMDSDPAHNEEGGGTARSTTQSGSRSDEKASVGTSDPASNAFMPAGTNTGSGNSFVPMEAQAVFGFFGEEEGAEARRGAHALQPGFEGDTMEWERTIDNFFLEMHPDRANSRSPRRLLLSSAAGQGYGNEKHDGKKSSRASWSEVTQTGVHMQKTLRRYSSVLRDRRKEHVVDISLPKYSGSRVVSNRVSISTLRRPRAVGRPTCYFTCACGLEVPSELEETIDLAPAPQSWQSVIEGNCQSRSQRCCSNTLAIWWFRPEEFAPVLITGYIIRDNHGRSFWVEREKAEELACVFIEQQRVPSEATQPENGFVACAYTMSVEAKGAYSISIVATTSHPLLPFGEASEPLHYQAPGITAPKVQLTGTHFDAAKGSHFTVRFDPPTCHGTTPCTALPTGYTLHWEMMSSSSDSPTIPMNRRHGSLFVSTQECHTLGTAKKSGAAQDAKGAAIEHRVVAEIEFPPQGSEDALGLRLCDGASYLVWISVECQHVQPGIPNVTSNKVNVHLPAPPEAVFVKQKFELNTAAIRCMQLYRALRKACEIREVCTFACLGKKASVCNLTVDLFARADNAFSATKELLQWIGKFDDQAIAPERLWTKSSTLLHEQRTRKVNIRTLMHIESQILKMTQDHESCRAEAELSLSLDWSKPKEYGALKVRRYVVEVMQAPWASAELLIPRYIDVAADSELCLKHEMQQQYRTQVGKLPLGRKTQIRMFSIAAVQDPNECSVAPPASVSDSALRAGLNLKEAEIVSMASNTIMCEELSCCKAFEAFTFAVSMAWHSLDINDFDLSFLDSSALANTLFTAKSELPASGKTTNGVWLELTKRQKHDNVPQSDPRIEKRKATAEDRWVGRGGLIAQFLRQVLQSRDDPKLLLRASLTMHREELCRNNLSRSIPISENEDIHGCSRIFKGQKPERVMAGSPAPSLHHLRPLQLPWASRQQAFSSTLHFDDGLPRLVLFWVPWMPQCRDLLRTLLQMQEEDLKNHGRVTWELVTVALRPSKEQIELYPDLRKLAESVDRADRSSLAFDMDRRPRRVRTITGDMVARMPPSSSHDWARSNDFDRPVFVGKQNLDRIRSSQSPRGRLCLTVGPTRTSLVIAPGGCSHSGGLVVAAGGRRGRSPVCALSGRREAAKVQKTRALRIFSDEMARSTRIATTLAVRILSAPSQTIRRFVRGTLPHASSFQLSCADEPFEFSGFQGGLCARLKSHDRVQGERIGVSHMDLLSSIDTKPEDVLLHQSFSSKRQSQIRARHYELQDDVAALEYASLPAATNKRFQAIEDHNARLSNTYNITTVPTMVVTDSSGMVTWRGTGGWLDADVSSDAVQPQDKPIAGHDLNSVLAGNSPRRQSIMVEQDNDTSETFLHFSTIADKAQIRFLRRQVDLACSKSIAQTNDQGIVPSALERAAIVQSHLDVVMRAAQGVVFSMLCSGCPHSAITWPWEYRDEAQLIKDKHQDDMMLERQRRAIQAVKHVDWQESEPARKSEGVGKRKPLLLAFTHNPHESKLLRFSFLRWQRREDSARRPNTVPPRLGSSGLNLDLQNVQHNGRWRIQGAGRRKA